MHVGYHVHDISEVRVQIFTIETSTGWSDILRGCEWHCIVICYFLDKMVIVLHNSVQSHALIGLIGVIPT